MAKGTTPSIIHQEIEPTKPFGKNTIGACKTCFAGWCTPMSRGDFWHGMTKEQTLEYFSAELKKRPCNTFFAFPELTELLSLHHWRCLAYGQAPERFMKDITEAKHRKWRAYVLKGHFPCGAIQAISFREAINPKTTRFYIVDYLRKVTRDYTADYINNNPTCVKCGAPAREADHVYPPFSKLADIAYKQFTEAHWRSYVEKFRAKAVANINADTRFSLPEDHPSVRYILWVHEKGLVTLQSLCVDCHKKETKARRSVTPETAPEMAEAT